MTATAAVDTALHDSLGYLYKGLQTLHGDLYVMSERVDSLSQQHVQLGEEPTSSQCVRICEKHARARQCDRNYEAL